MDFINQNYESGKGELFETHENPNKDRVEFAEFMRYISYNTTFTYSAQDYRQQMEILDQEGLGKEASIEDIRRVLGTYSNMDEK